MDKIDLELLRSLQKNGRTPMKHLAQEVFLSPPAVTERIERLERQGVITGFTARVDAEKLGFPLTAFVNLELDPPQKPSFFAFASGCPNILECHCVTGRYSILLKGVFRSPAELDDFIGKLQAYGHTQTQVVFSTPVPPRGVPCSPGGER